MGAWRRVDRIMRGLLTFSCLFASVAASAQQVIGTDEVLAAERPEAWAMAFRGAAIQPLGVAGTPKPGRGGIALGIAMAEQPHISTARRRVGFDGSKLEDLNKGPAFAALWLSTGLGAHASVALGWTPPVTIDGARPHGLLALTLDSWPVRLHKVQIGLRAFHQRGAVVGDITCDRDTAGFAPGSEANPFGCRAPSRDSFELRQSGLEAALLFGTETARWRPYLSVGLTRADYQTQIDAEVFSVRDRTRLGSRRTLRTIAVGVGVEPSPGWQAAVGLAWTPLSVRRPPLRERASDDLYSLNLRLWRTLR